MKIRIFGEVNPIEDEYYITEFHLTEFLDIELGLEFEDIPHGNNWILEYDLYIGNILNVYNEIERRIKFYLENQPEKNLKKENMRLTQVTISPEMEEYATWHYDGYIDPKKGDKDANNIFVIEVITDKIGEIIEFISY